MVKGKAIGIDLGTAFASIAHMQNGEIEVIPNERGNRRLPSFIAFTDNERLFFEDAKDQYKTNAANTIYDVQRLISRDIDDPTLYQSSRYWPFQLLVDNQHLKIEVNYEGERKKFYPEEIVAMLLSKLKEIAEDYLEVEVINAVITVPACFNYSQRMAMFDAAKIAGFNVLRLMNEPTAAAFAYDFSRAPTDGEHNVLVFDLGGCTLNVSVFTFEEKILNVRATAGDANLGGDDFDNNLVDYCLRDFNQRYKVNLSRDKRAISLLRKACEHSKRELSSSNKTIIQIESLYEGVDYSVTISREFFEELNGELFYRMCKIIERVMIDSKITSDQIHEVILVGGPTRMPRIQSLLKDYFGKEPNKSLNPDEAVASGAAVLAAMLTGDKSESIKDLLVLEISPYTYGVETNGGFMTPVIPRNTTIPVIHKQIFTSYLNPQKDYKMLKEYRLANMQPGVVLDIYEGENRYARDNRFLGRIELPIESDFDAVIEVQFDMDVNGVLIVNALDRKSGNNCQVTIQKGHLSKHEIHKLMRDALKYKHDDHIEHERVALKNSFESFCFEMKSIVKESKIIEENDRQTRLQSCEEALKWIESNEAAHRADIEAEFRKLAKLARNLICPRVLDLYKTAFERLGDSGFLFDNHNNSTNTSPRHSQRHHLQKSH